MSAPVDIGLHDYQAFLTAATVFAAAHAYRKLSPFFCVSWFGAGWIFAYLWTQARPAPEVVLLPPLVFYLAAALTKGLVETRASVQGNHLVHVAMTGVLSGVVALPLIAVAGAMGWSVPRPASRVLLSVNGSWLGGPTLDAVWLWIAAGGVFYGAYKLFDHVGLSRGWQLVLLFGSTPFLVMGAEWLHGLA